MAEFLLEIFSEEIPARMQEKAAIDLVRLVTGKLQEAKLEHNGVSSYVTARRLTLYILKLLRPSSQMFLKNAVGHGPMHRKKPLKVF